MIDLTKMSNEDLMSYKHKIEYQISEFDNIQNALKITSNSAYGTLGSVYNRWYDIRLAEAVTVTGQIIIRTVFDKLNVFLNRINKTTDVDFIIAGDTDSVYLTLSPIVDKKFKVIPDDLNIVINFMNDICEQIIEPELDKMFNRIYKNLNGYEKSLSMKREALCSKGMWIKKKHYILDIYDNEHVRYSEPKLKIVGIKAIKSTTPKLCRDSIREGIRIIMRGTQEEFFEYVENFKNKFYSSDVEDIGTPISMNDSKKYKSDNNLYKLGSPCQVKAAIVYNDLIDKLKLIKKYDKIKDKEKIKYLFLMEPNPISQGVIGYIDKFPVEFGLHKYIDYDKQFQTGFTKSLESILELADWKFENKRSLLDF